MDNKTINQYIDILAQAEIEKNTSEPAHYKANAYQNASNVVLILSIAHAIDKVLSLSRIQSIGFDFSEEYNDNGGTYLAVSGLVAYSDDGDTHEDTFYDGEPDFIHTLANSTEDENEQIQDAFYQLWDKIKDIGSDEYSRSQYFFDTQFTQKTSAISVFRKNYVTQMALIEKAVLQENVSDAGRPSSRTLKI